MITHHYYEIYGRSGEGVMQRVTRVSEAERAALEERGYSVVRQSMSATVWRWLLTDEFDEDEPPPCLAVLTHGTPQFDGTHGPHLFTYGPDGVYVGNCGGRQ